MHDTYLTIHTLLLVAAVVVFIILMLSHWFDTIRINLLGLGLALLALAFLAGCQTTWFKKAQSDVGAWSIAHRPQIEQTAFLAAQNVGQDLVKAFLGGYQDSKFSFAAGLQSLEGNYTSPTQVTALVGIWSPNTPAFNQAAGVIAADLANHPPTNRDQVVARLEGYAKGLQGSP